MKMLSMSIRKSNIMILHKMSTLIPKFVRELGSQIHIFLMSDYMTKLGVQKCQITSKQYFSTHTLLILNIDTKLCYGFYFPLTFSMIAVICHTKVDFDTT